jgi:hypothetical protein
MVGKSDYFCVKISYLKIKTGLVCLNHYVESFKIKIELDNVFHVQELSLKPIETADVVPLMMSLHGN